RSRRAWIKHQLASSEYNVRRAECEEALKKIQTVKNVESLGQLTCEEFEEVRHVIGNPVVEKRAKHAVYENQRTLAAVKALERNDIEAFGRLMNESHVSLRDDYAVSCPEIDYLTATAWTIPGVIGSRITGGGFGGCSVSIIKNDAIEAYKEAVTKPYKEKFGLNLEFYVAEPGEGARKLS
ncbi:MAG: galactokinase, partial [Lachnospiraceae bacterium]|nr:galactokinase [Lachnospiraceae bacterium]